MTSLLSWPPLPIPIPSHLRERSPADSDSQHYQHRLATSAISSYLKMIAVPHRLDPSPAGPRLYVDEVAGYIGCCPVLPNADKCFIPFIETDTFKGFLFVEIAAPYHQAQVLGFVRQITASELPLGYLQPLTEFTAFLEAEDAKSSFTNLSDWASRQIAGWVSFQEGLANKMLPHKARPAWAMRSASSQNPYAQLFERYATAQGDMSLMRSLLDMELTAALIEIVENVTNSAILWQAAEQLAYADSRHPLVPAIQVRPLSGELNGLSVAMMLGVISRPDKTFLVECRLYATGEQVALPPDVLLRGIDETTTGSEGAVFCEITPPVHGDPLEYLFTAEGGDRFSYQVCYQGATSTCRFVLPTQEEL